jgi:hypothetical protein
MDEIEAAVKAAVRAQVSFEAERAFLDAAMAYCERAIEYDHDAGLRTDMLTAYRALMASRKP